jgi:hypothetical protein
MLFKRYLSLIALAVGLTSLPSCLSAPPGMRIRAYQWHRVGSLETRVPIQLNSVTGDWQEDTGYNADAPNEITHFRVNLDRTGQASVENTRSPARWVLVLGAICVDNRFSVNTEGGPGSISQVVLPCERIRGIPFRLAVDPDTANAQAMPGSFQLTGEGDGEVDLSYGMPEIDFFDPWGNLAGIVTASSFTVDGQGIAWITGSMPSLTYNGTYYITVGQWQADSSLEVIGTSTMAVFNGQDPPVYDPPPEEDPCGPDLCLY